MGFWQYGYLPPTEQVMRKRRGGGERKRREEGERGNLEAEVFLYSLLLNVCWATTAAIVYLCHWTALWCRITQGMNTRSLGSILKITYHSHPCVRSSFLYGPFKSCLNVYHNHIHLYQNTEDELGEAGKKQEFHYTPNHVKDSLSRDKHVSLMN